jgi:glycyl-tRNA synthetase
VPHVIEPSFGVDRALLAVLLSAYHEDGEGENMRAYLKFKPSIAPVLCAVSPLLKNKPELVEKARSVFSMLKKEFGNVMWDDNGNIGKRYRRQDEIGTPFCIVIDFDTIGDPSRQGGAEAENKELLDTVTIRHRDSGEQERVAIAELVEKIKGSL